MTSKILYRIQYLPTDPTPAEYAAGRVKDTIIYRYAANDGQAIIVAEKNLPSAHTIGSIRPAPNLPTIDNN